MTVRKARLRPEGPTASPVPPAGIFLQAKVGALIGRCLWEGDVPGETISQDLGASSWASEKVLGPCLGGLLPLARAWQLCSDSGWEWGDSPLRPRPFRSPRSHHLLPARGWE